MTVAEDRRSREPGFYFTAKQFAGFLLFTVSTQLGINWWAAKSWVHETAVEVLRQHNTDPDAHARALLVAQQERTEMIRQVVVLQTKIDALDARIKELSEQTYHNANGNGRH